MADKPQERVRVVSTSDDATVVDYGSQAINVFQTNQRALLLVVGRELTPEQIREFAGDAVVEAMAQPKATK